MSQLVARPGRNAARQGKKLKEIRKVQNAIVYHERERKQRQKVTQERWESKQVRLGREKWNWENVVKLQRRTMRNAREDWTLGPLRPNRAIGADADKYGTVTAEQAQKPDIPVHTQKSLNEYRIKKGLEPEYPLVVDDEKYFHIEKDDRVVVVNGREKGKIGIVQNIIDRTHEIIVKGVNKQYYDSNVFNNTGEDIGPRRESEVPIPIADVRLVIPYAVTKVVSEIDEKTGVTTKKSVHTFQDVIVEKVHMERHTTGIDPFTGTNYGTNEIPKEHQYDPISGLPIFHRYIAGTRHRIEWPWEKEELIEDSGATAEGPVDAADGQTRLRRYMNNMRHPLIAWRRYTAPSRPKTATELEAENRPVAEKFAEAQDDVVRNRQDASPKSKDPKFADAYDVTDTTRNIVEGAESMQYTLVAPPFPDTLGEELREDVKAMHREERKKRREAGEGRDASEFGASRRIKPKFVSEQSLTASEIAQAKQAAAQKMKTPMQLRWETEHAKKVEMRKKAPLVSTEELMMALGKHMLQQRQAKVSSKAQAVNVEVE